MAVVSLRPIRRHWAGILAVALVLFYIPWGWRQATGSDTTASSGVVTHVAARGRWVALAFADGPSTAVSQAVLQDLARNHAHATFFVVGLNLVNEKGWARRAMKSGNEIQSHGEGHINLAVHSFQQDLRDLSAANHTIETITGVRPRWLSPPYGELSQGALAAARRLGLTIVLPSRGEGVDAGEMNASAIVRQVMAHVEPGAIILLHDGTGNQAILRALPTILHLLTVEGYHIESLSQVWAHSRA